MQNTKKLIPFIAGAVVALFVALIAFLSAKPMPPDVPLNENAPIILQSPSPTPMK